MALVEGPTEETFCRDVLYPHLAERGIYLKYTLATTRRVVGGPDYHGGITSYARFKGDLARIVRPSHFVGITTMVDLYGLPKDWPGIDEAGAAKSQRKAQLIEQSMAADVADWRYRPYIQCHEYEALLFTDVDAINETVVGGNDGSLRQLRQDRNHFDTPEEIDEGIETAPSKRIARALPQYNKRLHGPTIAVNIGLERLRTECRHFGEWLDWLESLA